MKIPNPFTSHSTWGRIVESSIRHAEELGDRQVGAEHLLLAALDAPGGAARRAFSSAGADPDSAADAIRWSHASALRAIGIEPVPEEALRVPGRRPRRGKTDFGESSRQVISQAAVRAKLDGSGPLDLFILDAVGDLAEGTAARALRELGLAPGQLHGAVLSELASLRAA